MRRFGVHRLAFAVVAPIGAAAGLAWALFGTAGLRLVAAVVVCLAAAAVTYLRVARVVRGARKPRPVLPEDRERRREERAQRRLERERLRRGRVEALRRYGGADTL